MKSKQRTLAFGSMQGFTLLELMIVISIMGILAMIGSFSFQSSLVKSRDIRRKSDLTQVAKALEAYYNDKGRYPSTSGGTMVACGTDADTDACAWGQSESWQDDTSGTVYMVKLPTDPKTSQAYYYDAPVDGKSYTLYAKLENTQDKDASSKGYGSDGWCVVDSSEPEDLCNYGIASSNTTLE